MIDEEDLVEVGDDTPTLAEQAKFHGWRSGTFNFGKAEEHGVSWFNPGLVRRPDGLWLIVRRSVDTPGMIYGKNDICAFKLDEKTLNPTVGTPLQFPDSGSEQQFEDPRAVYWNNQVWIGAVNFTWHADGSWTGAHQCIGIFRNDAEWTPIARRDPPVEGNREVAGHTNGIHQKNWLYFFHEDKLHLIYHSDPWHVIEFGGHWDEQTHYRADSLRWKHGQVRGGTPPVLVGDRYFTFFHSSVPWRGRYRRYFMGVMAFEAKPPFKPLLMSPLPLLTGSQNEKWHQHKPLVVFPCGAVFENDEWLISYGVNDLFSGWVRIPHEDVLKLAQPKPPAPGAMLAGEKTPVPVYERIPQPTEPVTLDDQPEAVPVGGTGLHGIECTCLKKEFPCPFHFRDNEGLTNGLLEKCATGLLADDARKQKLRYNLAKARKTLAEKRARGEIKPKKRQKKRKRKNESSNHQSGNGAGDDGNKRAHQPARG